MRSNLYNHFRDMETEGSQNHREGMEALSGGTPEPIITTTRTCSARTSPTSLKIFSGWNFYEVYRPPSSAAKPHNENIFLTFSLNLPSCNPWP